MSSGFNNYLGKSGFTILKDYQHAARLYVDDNYAYIPKVGFLYFVQFNINPEAAQLIDPSWAERDRLDVGVLVKRIDLPKYTIGTETLNQYNRKTIVQTKLSYGPVSVEFHDDSVNVINSFWKTYYKHYFADSNQSNTAFSDTKYKVTDYGYGLRNNGASIPFLESIEIFVLNFSRFTQYTLINPKITEWQHDSVNQSDASKILQNRMTVAYENVLYNEGDVKVGSKPENWALNYYDKTPSPNSIGGNPVNNPTYVRGRSTFDQPGKSRVYGRIGGNYKGINPLLDIASILAKNYVNRNGLGKSKSTGYNIASGVLGAIGNTAPGKYASPPNSEYQPGILQLPGGIGINIFKGLNTSVDGKVRANPASIIFPPRR